jgi:hypothetical protein
VKVYVQLLNEGTSVSRPTTALPLGNGLYKLLPVENYDPDDEDWEFKPGQTVRLAERKKPDGVYLLAVSEK